MLMNAGKELDELQSHVEEAAGPSSGDQQPSSKKSKWGKFSAVFAVRCAEGGRALMHQLCSD